VLCHFLTIASSPHPENLAGPHVKRLLEIEEKFGNESKLNARTYKSNSSLEISRVIAGQPYCVSVSLSGLAEG
jgi:hypothetical protein